MNTEGIHYAQASSVKAAGRGSLAVEGQVRWAMISTSIRSSSETFLTSGEIMSDTMLTSLISIIGIVLSVTVSIITTRLQNKIELEKIKRELDQQYAKSLFDERIKSYPELFKVLSDYVKIIQYGKQTPDNLRKFRDKVDNWNNQYGMFFTRPTARLSARFRWYLHTLLEDKSKQIEENDWSAIYSIIGYFEDCLKAEIGVSRMEPAGFIEKLDGVYKFIEERSNYNNRQYKVNRVI